jgi:hypothetical protein
VFRSREPLDANEAVSAADDREQGDHRDRLDGVLPRSLQPRSLQELEELLHDRLLPLGPPYRAPIARRERITSHTTVPRGVDKR